MRLSIPGRGEPRANEETSSGEMKEEKKMKGIMKSYEKKEMIMNGGQGKCISHLMKPKFASHGQIVVHERIKRTDLRFYYGK